MGAWGTGLYQDDVSCDVKEEYLNRLRVGMSNEEATRNVIEYNMDLVDDYDDGPIFWFALADTQWKYGRLLEEVKKEALKQIEAGTDLLRWEENKKQYQKREQVLNQLKERLNSPQPSEKKITKIKLKKALWNIGDVLLYKIQAEKLKDNKWHGKYVLFRVISITRTNIGSLPFDQYYHEQNVLALYNWVGDEFSENIDINDLDFIICYNTFFKKKIENFLMVSPDSGKKMGMVKILEDKNYDSQYKNIDIVGLSWVHETIIDYSIINYLKAKEEEGKLNDQTK